MSKLLYLDILRMTSPGDTLESSLFDFYVFGSFDAIKVESALKSQTTICSLQELHSISKRRRLEVPSHYDKQSMHLYTPNDSAENIFKKEGEFASWPLVLTLIQLDDYHINKDNPSLLVSEFRKYIDSLLGKDNIGQVKYEVFFCLGEPDIVIAFRYGCLSDIARLIYRIRLWVPFEKGQKHGAKDVCVLSTSSHCAFPSASTDEMLKSNLEKWISKEQNIQLLTMFDSSYGLDSNVVENAQLSEKNFRYNEILLGEWDYIYKWNNRNVIASRLTDHIFKPLTNFDTGKTGYFRSSYSVPVIGLQDVDLSYAESDRKLKDIQSNDLLNEYEGSNTAFSELSEKIKGLTDIYGSAEVTQTLSGMVDAMQSTLVGILKHLWQLKDGRFQYDLYAFVLPVFEALPKITNNITSLMSQTQENCQRLGGVSNPELQKAGEQSICDLLDCYIHDISRLLTELQHLFSVLSISPHTYLESYGSNMRSITATCKLLVAYQGIAYCLSKHFRMELVAGRERVHANEVMLVVPYRRIRQNTRVLFECTSPENRIVYIRINASDMFVVQKTLFMLLHECGHHILKCDFRKERIQHYFKAYAGYLLDQAFGPIYRHPHMSIQMQLNSFKDFQEENKLKQRIHVYNTSEDSIRTYLIEMFREKENIHLDLNDYWEDAYKNLDRVQALSEPVTLENELLVHVKESACAFMEEVLSILKEKKDREDFCSVDLFSEHIYELIEKIIIKRFYEVIEEEYIKRLDKDDSELWYLSELMTIYREYPEERISEYVKSVCLDVFANTYMDIAEEIKNIFSDIYSDVFALSMLRTWELSLDKKKCEARKYIALLRDEAGFQIKDEFNHDFLLVRILAVLQKYFGISPEEADELVVEVLSLPPDDSDDIRKKLKSTRNRIGYEAVENYTEKLCVPHVQKQVEDSVELGIDTRELFHMYHSAAERKNLESLINAVFYFWKASTERE